MNVSWKWLTVTAVLIGLIVASGFICYNIGIQDGFNSGAVVGYNGALKDVANLLQEKGITLDWHSNTNGSYTLKVITANGQSAQVTVSANLVVEQYRDGRLVSSGRGAGTFTDVGKNWTIQQISALSGMVAGGTGINTTSIAKYLGDALNTTAATSTTYMLPGEYNATAGLHRQTGTPSYVSVGVYSVTVTKTANATATTQLWGLYYLPYSATDTTSQNSLVAWDTGGYAAKNLVSADTLQETWTITLS
jgi:hypothetical protein